MENDIIYKLINEKMNSHEKRLDKFEEKIDELIKFKYTWVGRISVLAVVGVVLLKVIEKVIP